MKFPKDIKKIDEAYLKKVRKEPCCISKIVGKSEAHHIEGKGQGKRNDYKTVPLIPEIHRSVIHQLPYNKMNKKFSEMGYYWIDWVITKKSLRNYFNNVSRKLNEKYRKGTTVSVKNGKYDYGEIVKF